MFELYENVFIKAKNIPGTIVDIINDGEERIYTVESNIKGERDNSYGGIWPLFDCKEDEIIKYKPQ